MNDFGKILKITGLIAGIIALGVLIGWLGSRSSLKRSAAPAPGSVASNEPQAATPGESPHNALQPTNRTRPRPRAAEAAFPTTNAPTVAAVNTFTNWEDTVDDILGSEGEDADKAREMLQLFPRLPADAQVEVIQHISNLTPDEDYAPLGQMVLNVSLPAEVLEILVDDVLNRPDSLKLPVLLEIAKNEKHPQAQDSRELLELFLEEDYGNDWAAWQAKMQEYLKENPD